MFVDFESGGRYLTLLRSERRFELVPVTNGEDTTDKHALLYLKAVPSPKLASMLIGHIVKKILRARTVDIDQPMQ